MPFAITATDQAKLVTYQETAAKGAVEKAVELLGRGMTDVAITDLINGRTYRAGEFRLLLQGGP